MNCIAEDEEGPCSAPAVVGAECSKHYTRRRRSGSYVALQPKTLPDAVSVTFKLERPLRTRLLAFAKSRKVREATVLRDAVLFYLDRGTGKKS